MAIIGSRNSNHSGGFSTTIGGVNVDVSYEWDADDECVTITSIVPHFRDPNLLLMLEVDHPLVDLEDEIADAIRGG